MVGRLSQPPTLGWKYVCDTNKFLPHFPCLVYISPNWERVKLVLGCSPFEVRHTGELMAHLVEDVSESWGIRTKVYILFSRCGALPDFQGGWPVYGHGQQHDHDDDAPQ